MLDLLFDFILDPIDDYLLVSRTEGSERGREAMDHRFSVNAQFWGFLVCLVLCRIFWDS